MAVSAHPYKGYLNTKFNIYVTGEEQEYIVYKDEECNVVLSGKVNPNEPHNIEIRESGDYIIKFREGTELSIRVEDGYKFGGGKQKKSFIFDKCPWCFVVMYDRTYFYNRETERSYVEPISPDNIKVVSHDYILIENNDQEESTIFSLAEEKPVLCISNIITYNEQVIVWEEKREGRKELCVSSLKSKCDSIERFQFDFYSIDSKSRTILYSEGEKVSSLSLMDNCGPINSATSVKGKIVGLVSPNIVISYRESRRENTVSFTRVDTNEEVKSIEIDGCLAEVNKNDMVNIRARQQSIEEMGSVFEDFPEVMVSSSYNCINVFSCPWDVFYTLKTIKYSKVGSARAVRSEESFLYSINTNVEVPLKSAEGTFCVYRKAICFYNRHECFSISKIYSGSGYIKGGEVYQHEQTFYLYMDSCLYTLSGNGYWDNPRELKLDFSEFPEFGIVKDKDSNSYKTLGGTDLGKMRGRNGIIPFIRTENYLIFSGGRIIHTTQIAGFPQSLSESLSLGLLATDESVCLCKLQGNQYAKTPILEDVYDTRRYQEVLLSENGEYILHRDSSKSVVVNVTNGKSQSYDNLSYVKHVNGIRPLFEMPASLQPILINPMTGLHIDCDMMSRYQFVSPDSNLYADSRLHEYEEYYYKETGSVLTENEYQELLHSFMYPYKEEKGSDAWNCVKEKRKEFVLANFDFLNINYPGLLNNDKTGETWNEFVIDEQNEFGSSHFLDYFVGKRGMAVIRNSSDDSEFVKINLGSPLLYINYVAFSADSKYVAIAGFRGSGGLLTIYNLESKEVVVHKNTNRAVWNVAFSKNNAFASYTSEPNTFFAFDEGVHKYENYEERLIAGHNFLSFSPDGSLFALSEQGYVSKYDKYGFERKSWGHQPSSLVEVRSVNDKDHVLFTFADLGEDGVMDAFRRGSVASVSFSNDNSRLMMVGNDGVVVIRNLHMNK